MLFSLVCTVKGFPGLERRGIASASMLESANNPGHTSGYCGALE